MGKSLIHIVAIVLSISFSCARAPEVPPSSEVPVAREAQPASCECPEPDVEPLVAAAVAKSEARLSKELEARVAERVALAVAALPPAAPSPTPVVRTTARAAAADEPPEDEPDTREPDTETVWRITLSGHEPTLGPRNAAITFVLWSSVDCALCRRQDALIEEALEAYGERARLVWKAHPQPTSLGEDLAAQAACAAHRQGHFWEYRERCARLNGARRDMGLYARLAADVGMDPVRFRRDMVSGACRQHLDADRATAARVGVVSVPTLTVNGRKLTSLMPYTQLQEVISEELAKAAALEVEGASTENLYDLLIEDGELQQPLADDVLTFSTPAPVLGHGEATNIITVFADYECPYSLALLPALEQLLKEHPDDVAVEVRHFPLPYHENARGVALSALEAAAQGRFEKFHTGLIKLPSPLHAKRLSRLAVRTGLDMPQYRKALSEGAHEAALDAQMAEAREAGVWATPSLFINGRKYLSPDRGADALSLALQLP